MPDRFWTHSPEHWRRVSLLFNRMLDATDPLVEAAEESNPQVVADAIQLWENLNRAETAGFLAKPVELIPPSPWQPQFAIGQSLLGRFEIQRLLGAGGMGEVYLAFDHALHEPVAVKTIRASLASDPVIRQHFLVEVQSARRVTHPNVCRINDLFEESGLPFLSMEYVEGERLSSSIGNDKGKRRNRALAIQLGEGLAAAHRVGILHCDFKPANVILTGKAEAPRAVITDFGLARALRSHNHSPEIAALSFRAGTLEYMAPELLAGGAPTIRTDIFAYGRVLGQVLPKHRMAARCQAARPEDRPASLDLVIRSLRGDLSRRLYLGAGIAAAAAAATYRLAPRAGLPLAARTRIAINGLRASEPTVAALFRELLITALRQSVLLTVVADDHLRSLLKAHGQPVTLPADHAALASTAIAGAEIALVIEGALTSMARGLKVSLDVFAPAASKPSLSFSEQVSNSKNLVGLADQTARRLRREFGESPSALRVGAGYTPLEQVTSASPEAVECYFRGMREHKSANADAAIAWFDQAVRLDPNFALAWLQRAVSLMGYRLRDSFDSYQRAFALRSRVTERERLWIEARCFNIVGDWDSALKSCLRLVTLFPEEPDFQRETAFQLTRLGRPREALPYNQRAAELDSTNVNNLSEWIVNHVSANLYDEALALCQRFREGGETNAILNWGAGLAQMSKDDFDAAYQTFGEMAKRPDFDRYARRLQCGPLLLFGRFQEAISILASDLAWDSANGEQTELNYRRVWLGMLEWIAGSPSRAREYAETSARLDAIPSSLQPLRETGLLALFLNDSSLALMVLDRLREIEARWPSSHTRGARSALEAATTARVDPDRAASLFDTARGLRPDALTLYPIALWQIENRRFDLALDTLTDLENRRGHIHRLYFPGLSTLARIHRARCLTQMSRLGEALRLYDWITKHWEPAGNYGIVAEVRVERQQLIRNAQERR